MTLEQHGVEFIRSTYTWILFFRNTVNVFSLPYELITFSFLQLTLRILYLTVGSCWTWVSHWTQPHNRRLARGPLGKINVYYPKGQCVAPSLSPLWISLLLDCFFFCFFDHFYIYCIIEKNHKKYQIVCCHLTQLTLSCIFLFSLSFLLLFSQTAS